jgi:hypothetical protein
MRRAFLLAVALGCGHAVSTPVGVGVATAVAAGTSAYSRSQGGCYAICQQGETCNGNTGLCEPLPCHASCSSDERCDQSGAFGDRCIKIDTALSAKAKADKPASSAPEIKIETKPQVPDAAKP